MSGENEFKEKLEEYSFQEAKEKYVSQKGLVNNKISQNGGWTWEMKKNQ